MQTQLGARRNALRSGAFREAGMVMCAPVAAAVGCGDPSERQRVASLVVPDEVPRSFSADGPRARFNDYCAKLTTDFDFDFGKVSVLEAIGGTGKKPVAVRAVIGIGIVPGVVVAGVGSGIVVAALFSFILGAVDDGETGSGFRGAVGRAVGRRIDRGGGLRLGLLLGDEVRGPGQGIS